MDARAGYGRANSSGIQRSMSRAVSFNTGDEGLDDENMAGPARSETREDWDFAMTRVRTSHAGTSADVKLLLFQTGTFDDEKLNPDEGTLQKSAHVVHKYCNWLSEHMWFTGTFMVLIAINVVMIAVETDISVREIRDTKNKEAEHDFAQIMEHVEQVFTGIFLIEIVIRLLGCSTKIWHDGWLVADTIIVFMAILDTWIFGPLKAVDLPSGVQFLRMTRAFRAFRAVRVLRVLRFFRPLRLIAEEMGEAFRQTFWIIIVTFIATWCFSVVITSFMTAAFVSHGSDPEWRKTLRTSQEEAPEHTLFLDTGTFGNMVSLGFVLKSEVFWGQTLVPETIVDGDFWTSLAGLIVLLSISVLLMVFYNIVCGIFISSFIEAGSRDTRIMATANITTGKGSVQELKSLFAAFDKKGENKITEAEMRDGMKNYSEQSISAGLHPKHASALFRHMDVHASGGVTEEEFIVGCIRVLHSSRNENALIVMTQQQKLLKDICFADRTYNNEVKLIKGELQNAENNPEHGLKKLGEKARQLATHLLRTPQAIPAAVTPRVQAGKTGKEAPGERMMHSLQENFQFKTRLTELQGVLKEMARGVDRTPGFTTAALLRDVLREEIMPHLDMRLPQVPRRNDPVQPAYPRYVLPSPQQRQQESKPEFRVASPAEAARKRPQGWALTGSGTAALSAVTGQGQSSRRWSRPPAV
mmetsp:Transcript_96470/g.191107  ORF Transcript_96470/g.191107 Transcript_96470/m.191107 type:complete len:697 (+) Transcript_96470:69-2159(+)